MYGLRELDTKIQSRCIVRLFTDHRLMLLLGKGVGNKNGKTNNFARNSIGFLYCFVFAVGQEGNEP